MTFLFGSKNARLFFALFATLAGTLGLAQTVQTINAGPGTQTAYAGWTVNFFASGSNTGYTWTGVTTGYNNGTATKNYPNPGTYTVTVQAPAGSGYAASNTVTMGVTVLAKPPQTISAGPSTQTIYVNQPAYFSATGSNTGYTWSGASGTPSSNSDTAQQTWTTPGTYTVSVSAPASGTFTASNTAIMTVTVLAAQSQTISAGPSSQTVYVNQPAYFSASGASTANYNWQGANGNGTTASGSWTTPGTYTVTVRVYAFGAFATSNTVTMTVNVLALQSQTISAGPSSQTVYANQPAYFSASGSQTDYNWTGANGTGSTASKTWTTPGTYSVSVSARASGAFAASNMVTMSVTVLAPQSQTISAGPSSQTVYVNQPAYFSASGGNTDYCWNWNGTFSWTYGSTGSHTWTTPGTYTVSVWAEASDAFTSSNVVTLTVTVQALQPGTLIATPATQTVCANETAYFSALGSTSGYVWTGASGNSTAAQQSWATPGNYTVSVQSGGTTPQTVTMNVTVSGVGPSRSQSIIATPATQTVYANEMAYFSAGGVTGHSGSGVGGNYSWTGATVPMYGNRTTAQQSWATPGTYAVSVQAPANGTLSASNTVTMSVTVLPPQSQSIIATPATQTVYANEMAYFSASGGSIGYAWTGAYVPRYGDGTTAQQSWTTPGNYTVTAQAVASGSYWNASNLVTMNVTVLPPQSQSIIATPPSQTVYANDLAHFSASGGSAGYTWTGASSNGATAQKSWAVPGSNTVTVQSAANPGYFAASNVVTLNATVLAPQSQTITAAPASQHIYAGQTAYFSASGSSSGTYIWTGASWTGSSSTGYKSWTTPGIYSVSVQAPANGNGIVASNIATMTVVVQPGPPPSTNQTNTGTSAGNFLATMWHKIKDTIGGPIELATGAESFSRPLFSFSGARNWGFAISYNSILASSQTTAGSLGLGWSFPYQASIGVSGSNLIIHWDATHANTFTPLTGSTGTFTSAEEAVEHDRIVTNTGGGWTLTHADQSSLVFDANGRLTEDHDPHGRKLALSYNGSGQLASITEPVSSTSLVLAYNTSGQVSSLTDATGAVVTFTYNAANLLTQIVNQNGKKVTFTYDSNRNLLTLSDNNGAALTTDTYDTLGRAITQTDGVAGHGSIQLGFQQQTLSSNIVTTATDKVGAIWIYTFDASYHLLSVKNPLGAITSRTYDFAGNQLSVTDPLGNTTSYTYDGFGNVTTMTDAAGKTTTYTYDARNNLLKTTDALANVTTRTYDANNNLLTLTDALGRTTTWTYDGNSLPLSKKLPRGGTFTYSYTNGNLTSMTDPNGVTTQYGYDANGRVLYVQDALGKRTTCAYDPIGNLLTEANPLTQTVTRTYDHRNRMLTLTDPTGALTSYAYDNNNNLLTVTDARGKTTSYAYDSEDRLLSATDPLGHVSAKSYDTAGELITSTDATGGVTHYQYDTAGRQTTVTDPLGNATAITYDPRSLPLIVTDPLNRATSFAYDDLGRRTSVTDPLNQITVMVYDSLSRLTNVTDPGTLATSQVFDQDGNRASLTNANGNATSFTDDPGGRVTTIATPAGRTTSYTYDARSLPLSTTLPSGHAATTIYDDAGRVASVADGVGTISFTRDNDGRTLTVTENGKTLTRVYDQLGRLTQFTDGAGNVLGYGYDDAGNLNSVTYPDGKTVTYSYDAANRLTTVTDWASRSTVYTYDTKGRLTRTTRPNGTAQTRSYDAGSQLTNLVELGSDGVTVIYSGNYTYDADARLLTEALVPSSVMLAVGQASQTFDSDNRLLTSSGQTATFDLDGNLLALPGANPASYSYDSRNRLISAGTVSYGYDAEGNRISVTNSTGTIQWVVNPNAGLSQALVRTAPDGTVTRYVYGLGLVYEDTGGAARYYHFNRRGDTVALTDDAGANLGRVSYGPFGEVVSNTAPGSTTFLFNGLYGVMTDNDGLYFHRARYYNPQLRRFINQDVTLGKIEVGASLNRFAYADGNPVNAIDPFGLAAADIAPTGSIANNAFGNTTEENCAPTSIRTIVATMTGHDPGIEPIQNQVAAAQGTPGQNWNANGTILGTDGITYGQTMTTVLDANGVPSVAIPNTSAADGTPNLQSLTNNVIVARGPVAVQVSFSDGSGNVYFHTITVQYQGAGNIVIANLTGNGGITTVSVGTFNNGQLSAGGTTYTLQPGIPTISPRR